MKSAYRTNKNKLSFYAMACGYLYRATADSMTVEMYLENAETHLYSVKGYRVNICRSFWEQFESKAEAEKFYASECRKIGAKAIWS